MVYNNELAGRVRGALTAEPSVREVTMFGGLSFMVNEKMVVSVGSDGDLLVRVAPERSAELLTVTGARPAEMGAGRAMGDGWISVDQDVISTDESFEFWMGVALEYNAHRTAHQTARQTGARSSGHQRRGPR